MPKRNRKHPQPAISPTGGGWELFDQRTGCRVGVFKTCADARQHCQTVWPDYTFRWAYSASGDAIGTAKSVRVEL